MPTVFAEFDATATTVTGAIRTRLVAAGWTDLQASVPDSATLSAAYSANTNTFSSAAVFPVGTVVHFPTSGYMRRIASVTGSGPYTYSMNAGTSVPVAMASGDAIVRFSHTLSSTTSTGAPMIVELGTSQSDGEATPQAYLGFRFFRTWTSPTTNVDPAERWLNFRGTQAPSPYSLVSTIPLHVTFSAGQDHFFVSIEGPRNGEPQIVGSYGSQRNTVAASVLLPYFATDTTPATVLIGSQTRTTNGLYNVSDNEYLAFVSRDAANAASWVPARMVVLGFPTSGVVSSNQVLPNSGPVIASDGSTYLSPYVVQETSAGLRGRLSKFFYAGANFTGRASDAVASTGSRVSIGGQTYTLAATNRGDGSWAHGGPFGIVANDSATAVGRSVLVAVPS